MHRVHHLDPFLRVELVPRLVGHGRRAGGELDGGADPALASSEGGETVQQVAQRAGIKPADLVEWNISRFANISVNSRVQAGTVFYVVDPASVDTVVTRSRTRLPRSWRHDWASRHRPDRAEPEYDA